MKTKAELQTENRVFRSLLAEYLKLDVIDEDAPCGKSDKLEDLETRVREILAS